MIIYSMMMVKVKMSAMIKGTVENIEE
jgi:hypothetical protein